MKTLSVKQPWAYLLCAGIKDIENRTWKLPEKYKGERVLIHASAKNDLYSFSKEQMQEMHSKGIDKSYLTGKGKAYLSAIIGSVRFVGCEINYPSIWAEQSTGVLIGNKFYHKDGDVPIYNWVLANPVLFDKPILDVKGKLRFWDYEMDSIVEFINNYNYENKINTDD